MLKASTKTKKNTNNNKKLAIQKQYKTLLKSFCIKKFNVLIVNNQTLALNYTINNNVITNYVIIKKVITCQ